MIFEVIIGAIVGGLCVLVGKLLICKWDNESDAFCRNVKLKERVEKLELETRYIADQPTNYYTVGSAFMYTTEQWEEQKRKNDVPINDVVKAIVKHLDMEIEKISAQTINNPMEVKVVKKPVIGQTIVGPTGIVTMPDGSGIPMPGTKRKYTKRKTNGQKAKAKKGS